MHELGTIYYVIDTVEKLMVENDLKEVGSITLEVGEVSGIIPMYLPTIPQGKTCPYCGSGNTFLVTGNEYNIKEIEAC